jgi:hypothetical protein
MAAHRATYAARFNARGIHRPPRPACYVRPTDEQIAALPEPARSLAFTARAFHDSMTKTGPQIAALFASLTRGGA